MAETDKTYEILNYYGLKTNIEDTKKWIKQYVAEALTGITTDLMTNVIYDELVSLRDNNNLKPGMLYRMTDYVTKVYSEDESISSAEHPFDLILFANTTNSLNENAFACLNSNSDGYFDNCNINTWEIKYSLDNDDRRFEFGRHNHVTKIFTDDDLWFTYIGTRKNVEDETQLMYIWYNEKFDGDGSLDDYLFTFDGNPEIDGFAGRLNYLDNNSATIFDTNYSIVQDSQQHTENGKGVIYYMKDEFNNEAPFDFKNILQKDDEYTFGNNGEDYSLNGYANGIYNNKILPQVDSISGRQVINKIRVTKKDCHSNYFKPTCENTYINFPISECDISMNDDGELVIFKTQDFVSGIENKPIEHDYRKDYLTFEAVNDNTEIIFKTYTDDPQYTKTIEVSKDKVNWETKTSSSGGVILASLNTGEKLYLRGNNTCYTYYDDNAGEYLSNFILPLNECYVYGNVMSLIDSNNFRTLTEITDNYALSFLFYDYWNGDYSSEHVLSHQDKKLVLPATTLANYCYSGMFRGCTSLATAPELPATTLADGCYRSMFYNCSSLTTAPELPATTLTSNCYGYMFNGCTSLTTASELPATTLANHCYYGMFYNCNGLTTAPELPATTLADWCYANMFNGCRRLNYIKCLAVNGINQNNSTYRWVNSVQTNSGTFVKHPNATTWPTGNNGIPTNWTVEDAVIE